MSTWILGMLPGGLSNKTLGKLNQLWEPWIHQYVQTIQEVNGQKMPERIAATRLAIAVRLEALKHDSDHHAERQQVKNALKALSELEREAQECL